MEYLKVGKNIAQSLANDTSQYHPGSHMQSTLFDAIIPGWSLISHFLSHTFGIDAGFIVTLCALCLGIVKGSAWLRNTLIDLFQTYCMSKVHIDDHDLLFDTVLYWLATQPVSRSSTSVRAVTRVGSSFDEDETEKVAADAVLDEHGHFNYGKLQARVPPQYEPHYGDNHFWYRGSYFRFGRRSRSHQSIWSDREEDELVLYCVGRSTEPIKRLLQEVKIWTINEQVSKTSIRHATSQKWRGSNAMHWSSRSPRPSRPMSTVILDQNQKDTIIKDMNEFLDPRSPSWYASRGIPYRRGYLFHGPPGTGKTSLSFALAGIFGLDLYCLSLNDPDLTEGDLRDLFNTLPRRCIVLLEDIDEAGIKRPDPKTATSDSKIKELSQTGTDSEGATNGDGVKESATESGNKDKDEKETKATTETQWTLQDLAKAIMSVSNNQSSSDSKYEDSSSPSSSGGKRRNANPFDKKSSKDAGISLSGLLNAIDGVATHEGRILIMTTNHPDALDEALVRAGRVDLRVAFANASHEQVRALFLRMYAVDVGSSNKLSDLDIGDNDRISAAATLEDFATSFAEHVPDREFSPSEVQGYLLMHKKTPRAALEGAETWVAEERKRKAEKKSAVVEVKANGRA